MSGPKSPSSNSITPKSSVPPESLPSAIMGAGEDFNDLHETIMSSDEEADLSSYKETPVLDKGKIEKEKATPEDPPPPVLYKVCYFNTGWERIYTRTDKNPLQVQSAQNHNTTAIEIITDVLTSIPQKYDSGEEEEPQTTTRILGTRMKINSPAIITALQSVIDYYPGDCFQECSTTISEPYEMLIYHEEELKIYRDQFHPNRIDPEEKLCQRKVHAYEHIGILQKALFELSGKEVEAERQRHALGYARFDMLWLLFKPGTDVYSNTLTGEDGNLDAFVIRTVKAVTDRDRLRLEMWGMNNDGMNIGRCLYQVDVPAFDGEREISSLIAFPCKYLKEIATEKSETKPLKQKLEERGKLFYRLAQRQCMDYDGITHSMPKKHVEGLTMVYTKLYYQEEGSTAKPVLGNLHDDSVALDARECFCRVCVKSKQSSARPQTFRYADYDEIGSDMESLTDHQHFLCPPYVFGYVFKSRTWESLRLYYLSDPTFDAGMIDTLVMKDERRRLIKALAENYQNGTESSAQPAHKPWAADFVAGKGEGKIFLLHGMPGVGKTYTAECIAAYTKRPLLSLTISDIGTVPLDADAKLNKHFTRAKQWNAIVLIDEADIYMERREVQDLTRNSLVSGFLRATENCQSILFLTTNRIGSFDDAFVSRIHVALYYPKFTEDDRRQIWKNFFDKLARDRKNIIHIPAETLFYATEPEVTSLEWNGREIRNAFQTAVALADFDGADEDGKIVLRKTHIQQIVRMSQEFKDYLKELHRGDEAKRAERQRIRYDEFVSDVLSQK